MIYYVDGFTLGSNPSEVGGGFTVTDEQGNVLETQTHKRPNYTNNEGELLGIEYAAGLCNSGDTIITDSKCAMAWVKSGRPKARPDLWNQAQHAKILINFKNITIEWRKRDKNLAGLVNERNHYLELFAKRPTQEYLDSLVDN